MSVENLQKFLQQAQPPSEDAIREAGTKEQFANLVVKLGTEQGFVFSEAEVLQLIELTEKQSEGTLSDQQLAGVVGGVNASLGLPPSSDFYLKLFHEKAHTSGSTRAAAQ
jgi:hypothetical protein